MKLKTLIPALCLSAAPLVADHAFAAIPVQTGTSYVTVDGDVVRYEPGKLIVVRGVDNKEVIYKLAPTITVPADVKVGRRVTLYTEPTAEGGNQIVSRVVTTSVTPEGNIKKTTEETRTSPGGVTTKTTTTTISGTVQAYEPGRTLTITRADGTKATYVITGSSTVPNDLVVGKTISIVPSTTGEMTIQTVTYVKPRQ